MESTERQMGSSFIGAVFGSIATFIRRVAKATILIAWLFVLVLLGALAASGQASKIIIDSVGVGPSRAYIGFEFRDDRSGYVTAASVLEDFSWRFKNPPPIEALLTKADPGWRSVDLYEAAPDEDQRTQATWVRQQYEDLFDGAAGKIFALVLDASSDPRATTVNYGELIPVNFRTDFVAEYIEFPHEVIAWIFCGERKSKR